MTTELFDIYLYSFVDFCYYLQSHVVKPRLSHHVIFWRQHSFHKSAQTFYEISFKSLRMNSALNIEFSSHFYHYFYEKYFLWDICVDVQVYYFERYQRWKLTRTDPNAGPSHYRWRNPSLMCFKMEITFYSFFFTFDYMYGCDVFKLILVSYPFRVGAKINAKLCQ